MKKRGQTVIEFSVLLAVMCVVCLVMGNYIRRSVYGRFKLTEEKINSEKQTYSTIKVLEPILQTLWP